MKKNLTALSFLVLTFTAFSYSALAQANVSGGFTTLGSIINSFTDNIIKALGGLFMGAAVVAFFYGVVQYVWSIRDGKPEGVKAGQQFMIWALVGLFSMFSVYGIVQWGQNLFGISESSRTITIPSLNFGRTGASSPGGTVPSSGGTSPLGGSSPAGTSGSGTRGVGSSCGRDTRCNTGLTCTASVCVDPNASSGTSGSGTRGVGSSCGRDTRCDSGLTCTSFVCVDPNVSSGKVVSDCGSVKDSSCNEYKNTAGTPCFWYPDAQDGALCSAD
jgi:hypothetical protein